MNKMYNYALVMITQTDEADFIFLKIKSAKLNWH